MMQQPPINNPNVRPSGSPNRRSPRTAAALVGIVLFVAALRAGHVAAVERPAHGREPIELRCRERRRRCRCRCGDGRRNLRQFQFVCGNGFRGKQRRVGLE